MDVSLLDLYNWLQARYTPECGVAIGFIIWYFFAWFVLRFGFERDDDGDIMTHCVIWILSPMIYPIVVITLILVWLFTIMFPKST